MRVLMTTDTIGGVWTFTQELASGLLERACAVTLVSLGRTPSETQETSIRELEHRWCNAFRFYSLDVPLEWMQDNEYAYAQAAAVLMEMLQDFSIDVLHSNQFCFGALPCAAAKVVTAHSDVFSWAKSCRGEVLEETAWLQRYRQLVDQGLRDADTVVAPTQWMIHALAETFQLPREVKVIPNGRSIPHMQPKRRKLQAVTAGRIWDEAKGLETLMHVASPFPVLVAGESADTCASRDADKDRVQMLGHLSQTELMTLFSESSIYVCASRYEPFGLAALEAALCGCAVVANDIGSLREVWEDGALYFSGPDSLSHLLQTLHADSVLLEQARERSWRRAQIYGPAKMTDDYLSAFHAVRMCKREMADVA